MLEIKEHPLRDLTIFLMKEEIKNPEQALRPGKSPQKFDIKLNSGIECVLYVQPIITKTPKWAGIFREYLDIQDLGLVSSSAAVLIIKASERLFALTFGYGRYLLQSYAWEERFGLRVALNSIGEGKIRSIDKKTFDAIAKRSREQTSKDVQAHEFGFDVERDLLRAVTGRPADDVLGNRMSGMDALHVSVRTDLNKVPKLLESYYFKFQDTAYKKHFPWVDHIAEIADKAIIDQLDENLMHLLGNRRLDNCWLAVPDIIDWTRVLGFQFARTSRSPMLYDISFPHFFETLSDPDKLTVEGLKRKHVYCLDSDGVVIDQWPVYRCAHVELEIGDESFLLSGGKWYRVDREFVAQINGAVAKINRIDLGWPEFADLSENAYNHRVAESHEDLAFMDAINIFYGGGHSQIEFCDLFNKNGDIVHVKRYGASNVFSHFFSQGLVSGELFVADPEFRKKLNEKLPQSHKLPNPEDSPNTRDYTIVFAVISEEEDGLTLPFFSRLNFRQAARRLEGFGYQVALAKITVEDMFKKTKRYAPKQN